MSAFSYIIFISVALLACVLGAAGAYFYYRARHREALGELEALDQDLAEREEELHRLHHQFANSSPGRPSNQRAARLPESQKLNEELEQKKNDYTILKQDFDLEIGILKQELDQLREEKSNVEHARRLLARKDAELEERETDLNQKQREVEERTEHLDAEIARRKKELEDELAGRAKRVEDDQAERDRELRARALALDEERQELERQRAALRDKQAQLDEDLFALPLDRFSSRQEGILIKRLRQQIKLQRDELEHLQRLFHKSAMEQKTRAGEKEHEKPDVTAAKEDAGARGSEDLRPPGHGRGDADFPGQDQGDSLPAYSALSSYVDRNGESTPPPEAYEIEVSRTNSTPERYDDLTLLPGIDRGLQRTLHELGITSFDQIARWSSADVRQVSEGLNVDRKTIQDHWIINAQSHLFSRNAD